MNLLLVLLVGAGIGALPGLFKLENRISAGSIVVGITGALVGAFLGFGDSLLLIKSPLLNETTLMTVFSLLFVIVKVAVGKND